uniref:Uncharacterized mitochondrial protein AtMg01000 n=2 Tax=Arabidopsis thaliana TaxID=3702 RepID=M1000_ARATH|nr:RecName: Full=Uncharacterized mitochondrial protein AtMg01000; AltName: Full=ORF114 [Arabidopsis thaliana]CAA69840.1 unnamed protein product [Arabidopsis thaliana]
MTQPAIGWRVGLGPSIIRGPLVGKSPWSVFMIYGRTSKKPGPSRTSFLVYKRKYSSRKAALGGTLSHKVCKPFGMGFCFFLYFSICRFFASKERENKVGCNDVRICTNFYLFSD